MQGVSSRRLDNVQSHLLLSLRPVAGTHYSDSQCVVTMVGALELAWGCSATVNGSSAASSRVPRVPGFVRLLLLEGVHTVRNAGAVDPSRVGPGVDSWEVTNSDCKQLFLVVTTF